MAHEPTAALEPCDRCKRESIELFSCPACARRACLLCSDWFGGRRDRRFCRACAVGKETLGARSARKRREAGAAR